MPFFDPFPEPDEPDDGEAPEERVTPPWQEAPWGTIPAALPVSALLSATDTAALLLHDVQVFDIGVGFDIEVRVRRAGLDDDGWDDLTERAGGAFGRRRRRSAQQSGPFRVGVQLADGTRVVGDERFAVDGGERAPRLTRSGGSGSGSDTFWTHSWRYWLWPLPPDGPLTIVTEWTRLGLPEASTIVDGSAFGALGRTARPIWPGSEVPGGPAQPHWSITFGRKGGRA